MRKENTDVNKDNVLLSNTIKPISDLQYAEEINRKGIRPSVQRVAIYKYLCEHKNHPTVDTVFSALSPTFPTLSKTTVYNTLHLFNTENLVQIVHVEDDELRYDADTTPHLHFKCVKCGKVIDIFDTQFLPSINSRFSTLLPDSFKMKQIQTNIWGTCSDCSSSN